MLQVRSGKIGIDVDHRCVATLEEAMFDSSVRAGPAGFSQWGLDAGPHKDGWNPYEGRSPQGDEYVPSDEDALLAVSGRIQYQPDC